MLCCRQVSDFDQWLLDKLSIFPKKVHGQSPRCSRAQPTQISYPDLQGMDFKDVLATIRSVKKVLPCILILTLIPRHYLVRLLSARTGGGTSARGGLRGTEATTTHTGTTLRIVASLSH